MHKPESVRVANEADAAALYWHLLGDYNADNGLGWEVSPAKLYKHVSECCAGENGIAGIIDGLTGIVGSVGIEVHTPWYSNDEFLAQVWLFVMPGERPSSYHWDNLFYFSEWYREDYSRRVGRNVILETSVQSHHRLPAKLRLWRRRARQIGGIFWVPGVEEPPKS